MHGGEELALNLQTYPVYPMSLDTLLAVHPTISVGQISRIQSQEGLSVSEMFM